MTYRTPAYGNAAYSGFLQGMFAYSAISDMSFVGNRRMSSLDPSYYANMKAVALVMAAEIDSRIPETSDPSPSAANLLELLCESNIQLGGYVLNPANPTGAAMQDERYDAIITAWNNLTGGFEPMPTPEFFWNQAAWFIDPVAGDDANDGLTSGTPVQHYAEVVRRWQTTAPVLGQDTTITFLDDQPDTTDPVVLQSQQGQGTGTTTIQGGLKAQTGGMGTFTAVTVRNRATGARWQITDGSKAANFWAAYVGMFVHDTTADAWFWVVEDLGGASAIITEPMASAIGNPTPAQVVISNGDSYEIFAPIRVNLVRNDAMTKSGSAPVVNQIWAFGAPFTASLDSLGGLFLAECRIDSFWDSTEIQNIANCYLFGVAFRGSYIAGGIITFELSVAGGAPNVIDGDCLVMAPALGINGVLTVGAAYFANSLDVPNMNSLGDGQAMLIVSDGALYGTAALWGPAAISVHTGGDVGYVAPTAVSAFLQAGAMTIDGSGTASNYDPGTGLWASGIAITPANLDLAVGGGGFGGVAYGALGSKIRAVG
jgi:hypothetical protein